MVQALEHGYFAPGGIAGRPWPEREASPLQKSYPTLPGACFNVNSDAHLTDKDLSLNLNRNLCLGRFSGSGRVRPERIPPQKDRLAMRLTSQSVLCPNSPATGTIEYAGRREEQVYQIVTVAAILLVLGSLWVF